MKVNSLRERFYHDEWLHNDSAFLELIQSRLRPEMRVLDAGAGAGDLFDYDLKDSVHELVGVNLDPRVETNPRLHRGVIADLTDLPFESESFDIIFSRYVFEHVVDPQALLKELRRVLKPGGRVLFLTPNKWHYVSLISRWTPHGFHEWINRRRGRSEDDTFPTVYRLNSRQDIRREFKNAGFVERSLTLRECCPNYLMFAWPAFLLGVGFERLVNAHPIMSGLRVNLLGDFEKPPA